MADSDVDMVRDLDRELGIYVVELLRAAPELQQAPARAAAAGVDLSGLEGRLDALIAASNRAEAALAGVARLDEQLRQLRNQIAGLAMSSSAATLGGNLAGAPPAAPETSGAPHTPPAPLAPHEPARPLAKAGDGHLDTPYPQPAALQSAPRQVSARHAAFGSRFATGALGIIVGVVLGGLGVWFGQPLWKRWKVAEGTPVVGVPASGRAAEKAVELGWQKLVGRDFQGEPTDEGGKLLKSLRKQHCAGKADCTPWTEVGPELRPDDLSLLIGQLRMRLGDDPCLRLVPGMPESAEGPNRPTHEVACLLARHADAGPS